jgi:hypothetical protein
MICCKAWRSAAPDPIRCCVFATDAKAWKVASLTSSISHHHCSGRASRFSRDARAGAIAGATRKRVARIVKGEAGDLDYRCACLLAELVGINLKDG